MHHRKAELETYYKIPLVDGSVLEVVIWRLPEPTAERPHGLKYRLNYCLQDGTTVVRYDNKLGKGDHKHLRDLEIPYVFTTVDKLIDDFLRDVVRMGGRT